MVQLSFVEFKKGSYILVDGADNNDRFFIIQTGRVIVSNSLDPGKNAKKILTTGDFVGVIPCMAGHAQIENAIALEDARAIAVKREQYPSLIEKNVPVALKIIRTFSNRMREMNEQLTQIALNNSLQIPLEQIYDVAFYYDKQGLYNIASYAYYTYLKESGLGVNKKQAEERFEKLKPYSHAVYYEPTNELTRNYPAGTMIMAESQRGSDMFMIQEGVVKITKIVDGNEVILSILKRGDMFGEMALLENKNRSANAIAQENCTLLVINRKNFDNMVSTQPQLIARLTTMLADRLWSMYRQLSNASLKDPLHKAVDMLAIQIEKDRKISGPYHMSISFKDLLNMCAVPKEVQPRIEMELQGERAIKVIGGKIFIPDCQEVIKLAAFFKNLESEKKVN